MSTLASSKQKYIGQKFKAFQQTNKHLSKVLGVDFQINEFSNRTLEAIKEQWGKSEFDWELIHRRYRNPAAAKYAIWAGRRLSGLCLADTHGQAVKVYYLEGDPREDCPLKGLRILIALDAAANYAQIRGKTELIVEPVNEKLISLYQNAYGFEVVKPKNGIIYCRRGI